MAFGYPLRDSGVFIYVRAFIEKKRSSRYDAYVMSNENKQLKYGAVISYIAIFINTLTALFYLPWMARKLGQSHYALYNLAFSFVNFFLVDFGLGLAVSRFASKYRAEENEEKVNTLVGTITKLYLAIDAVILVAMVIVYFFIDTIYKGLTPAEIAVFKPLYLIMTAYSILSFPFMSLNGILTAYEEFVALKLCDLGQKLLTVVLIIFGLRSGRDVTFLIIANVIGGALALLAKLIIVKTKTPVVPNFKTRDPGILRGVLAFSVWTAVVSVCQRMIFSLAPTILGIVSNSTEIALFSPANSLEGYFYMFAAAVNGLFLARISRYIAKNQEDKLFDLMVNVGRYQMVVMGLIFIGFLCVGTDFMRLWMGKEYQGAAFCAILMFVPDLLLFTQEIANDTVIAKNEVKHYAYANIGMAVICVVLSFILARPLGALGSSIAIAISYFFTFVYMNIVYYKKLHLDIFTFFRKCYGSFILPYAITIILSRLVLPHIHRGGWIGLGIKALFIAFVYLVSIWFLALKKEEKNIVLKRFKKA